MWEVSAYQALMFLSTHNFLGGLICFNNYHYYKCRLNGRQI